MIFFLFVSQFTRLTDRRTDRRTDRILIARPRLHFMQRGKNATCQERIGLHIKLTARKRQLLLTLGG